MSKKPCTCAECRLVVITLVAPAVCIRRAIKRPATLMRGASFLSDRA